MPPETKILNRTSDGLREVLFAELDMLRNGTVEPARAHAVAKLAQQILNSVQLELAAARAFDRNGAGERKLPNLRLVG